MKTSNKRKLYILEFNGSYIGGGLIVVAKDLNELSKVIKSYNYDYPESWKVISDQRLVQLYILSRWPFIESGIERNTLDLILTNLTLIRDEIISIVDNDSSVSFSQSKKIRLDWVCSKVEIPDGIYLIKSLDLEDDFSLPQIISDTYYEG